MVTKSTVLYNADKNRIYIRLEGYHDVAEATRIQKLYAQAIRSANPQFTVLIDLSSYLPSPLDVQEVHVEAMRLAEEAGVRKVARVTGDIPLGAMQVRRIAQEAVSYPSAQFDSVQEAEAYLNE